MDYDEEITFHIVCHSHMETGWQTSLKQFQNLKAPNIFSGVMSALERTP